MLEFYFKDPRRLKRFQSGLLAPHFEDYTKMFHELGYARDTVRSYLRTAFHFASYGVWTGKTNVKHLTHEFAREFLNDHLPDCSCERMNCGKYSDATAALDCLLQYLVERNLIDPPVKVIQPYDAMSEILVKYDDYLDSLLGLSIKTRKVHRVRATVFMNWLKDRYGNLSLSTLNTNDILNFQEDIEKNSYSFDHKKTITSCLRGFLRFLRWERILENDLTHAVYPIIQWNLSTIPKYMPYDDVLLLLQAPDRNTGVGKRDLAMLILMSYLGLRANEVVNLKINDIDFKEGSIKISKTKTSKERLLPLTIEIADILIDYIKNARHNSPYDGLFLRAYAPRTPIKSSPSVGGVVRKYLKETGIKSPTLGTHQLRHSLATHLINKGVTLKEIADLLGHSSIETTGIYAKVQTERLKVVPLPFPGKVCKGGFQA